MNESAALLGTNGSTPELDLTARLRGKQLVVVGGTGFLGKVWWALLLTRFPEVGHLYLVVRPKAGKTVEKRFWEEIVKSEVLVPLRERHGADFEAFIRSKVTPIAGDVVQPMCGLDAELRDRVRGRIAAVVNVAGVVDFDPPLDEALEVNAFGCQNLVALARDLGDVPVLHTSTCYVAGRKTGPVEERDPREFPFPRADELERSDWDPDREIAECLDVIGQARQRANDAFRQSRFLDEAKKNLRERGEPARGEILEAEIARVKRKFVESQLAQTGMERAQYWGWPNTYTYTKSIGEQIVAASGLPYTIVRPAIVESTVEFPFPGWNEGINTSAPLIFMMLKGGLQLPGDDIYLDVIPCDMVAAAITLALGELLEGRARPVYQAGSTDTNPCTVTRFFELTGLYKRRHYKKTGQGGPLISTLQAHWEGALLSKHEYERFGPRTLAAGAETLSSALRAVGTGPWKGLFQTAAKGLDGFAVQQRKLARIMDVFLPFTAEFHYIFRCDNTRAAYARLSADDKKKLFWAPESIDWRKWFLEIHVPALERHVFPLMEERLRRPLRAPERHRNLVLLLEEMADRYDLKIALQRTEQEGLSRLSYRDVRALAASFALRLRDAGVQPGGRVMLGGANHPAWPIAFFGILYAGAMVVPVDANLDARAARTLVNASGVRIFVADRKLRERVARELPDVEFWDLAEVMAHAGQADPSQGPLHRPADDSVAALIYTSGTTGKPKGVMLTHANLTALIASLAPLFPLTPGDRVLSVLPLHHTFELTCGLLLPLSRGARVIYLDELSAERLERGLKQGRATALIGVPALWEMLERRIHARVAEHGAMASRVFDYAVELNRALGKHLGIDAGRLLFGPVHEALGGHLRFLVSGGAALNPSTHRLFQGLGLHLAEGYGLTEASPVLTVAPGGPRAKAGTVGKPVPGVELRIDKPNAQGVGEVLARGPNVMLGYSDDEEATRLAIDPDGWLRTGDLGKLDGRGQLVLVGRAKDVIVASNGENVYPDDVEARLGQVEHVAELSVLGVPDGRGGERVACVAVPAEDASLDRAARHERAKAALEAAVAELPSAMRPAIIKLVDAPLPRTSTRKVKRAELRDLVMRLEAAEKAVDVSAGDEIESAVRAAVATIARRRPSDVMPNLTLRGDLGFDSLMALELLVALEARFGALDGDRLSRCTTVSDVVSVLREVPARRVVSRTREIEREDEEPPVDLPEPLREAAMAWMARAQMGFYRHVMRTRVTGRAFIPHNRSTLVVANHTSHLDMGLVKYALGSYGKDLAALAAQDYFFEGNRWRKAYFEQLTNLVPMSRNGSLRQALRQVGELIEQGKTILIFPEGTRSIDGRLLPFKPAVGYLALHHGIDILPVWLGGTHAALPKGATVIRSRNLVARINPPLSAARLREMTAGLSSSDAARVVARIAQLAVETLARGETLSLDDVDITELRQQTLPPPDVLEGVFEELERRFDPSAVESPLSFYFALGEDRWTLRMTPDSCDVARGKLVDSADCVLKTSPDMFRRIVREAYTPTPQEFMTGQIKTNNVAHLLTFQKVFRLQTPSAEWEASSGRAPTTGVFREHDGEGVHSGPRARAAVGARKETA